jgi:hypothetical protein
MQLLNILNLQCNSPCTSFKLLAIISKVWGIWLCYFLWSSGSFHMSGEFSPLEWEQSWILICFTVLFLSTIL